MDGNILTPRLGLPELANKNTQFLVKFEFYINNEHFSINMSNIIFESHSY